MTQTCICWGFDHGDGWFEIIQQLSLAIEEELAYSWIRERWYPLKKFLSRRWKDDIAYRRQWARKAGLGFVVPSVPQFQAVGIERHAA